MFKRLSKYNNKSEKVFQIFNIFFLIFICLLIIFPLLNIVALSFNDSNDALRGGIYFLPRQFSLVSYNVVLANEGLRTAFVVTVLKTLIGVGVHILVTGVVAYALSKKRLLGRGLFMKLGVITMYFSGGLIPTYILMKNLGLVNSFWVYVIPAAFSFYDMIIMMNFFRDIPDSLEESAIIDGASEFQTFFRIYLPLSLPVVATIALFHGVYQWNDFLTARLYITSDALYPMQYILFKMITETTASVNAAAAASQVQQTTTQSLQIAMMIITTIPILVIYPFLQKYFVKGMVVGAVKE